MSLELYLDNNPIAGSVRLRAGLGESPSSSCGSGVRRWSSPRAGARRSKIARARVRRGAAVNKCSLGAVDILWAGKSALFTLGHRIPRSASAFYCVLGVTCRVLECDLAGGTSNISTYVSHTSTTANTGLARPGPDISRRRCDPNRNNQETDSSAFSTANDAAFILECSTAGRSEVHRRALTGEELRCRNRAWPDART